MSVNKKIFYSFLTQLPILVLGVASGIFITRILGAEGRGVYSIFYNDIQFLCLFLSLGLNTGLIYFISGSRMAVEKLAGVSVILLGGSTLLLTVLLLGSVKLGYGGALYPDGHSSLFYTAYLAVSYFFSLANVLMSAIFQGRSDFRTVNRISVFNSLINCIAFVGLYAWHRLNGNSVGIREVLLFSLLVLVLNTVAWVFYYAKLIRAIPKFNFSMKGELLPLFSFAALIHLSNVINFFNYRLDIWIVDHFKGSGDVGIYSLSANIAQMFWLVSTPIANVLLPHLSGGTEEERMRTFAFYSRINFSLILGLAVIAWFCAGIIPFVYGAEFNASILPFRLLLIGIVFSCHTKMLATYVIARGANKYTVLASSAGFAVTLTLDLLLIPPYGITGASIATIASYFVILASYLYFSYGLLGLRAGNHLLMTKDDIAHLKNAFQAPSYNMFAERGEQFYYRVYRHHAWPHIPKGASVLDIGCQYGRFSIPLAEEGCKVTATDIDSRYFTYIRTNCTKAENLSFFKEGIDETVKRCKGQQFDAILCLEVLYTLPHFEKLLEELRGLLAPGGVLIASHRSRGYYLERYRMESNPEAMEQIKQNKHPLFNAQTTAELNDIYTRNDFKVILQKGIGMYSGIGPDPLSRQIDPGKLSEAELHELFEKETGEGPIDSARYILMIARK